jgi:hypothetical protein
MKKKIKTGITVFLIIIVLVVAFFELKYRVKVYDSPYFQVYGYDYSDETQFNGKWQNENNRFNPLNDKKILCEFVATPNTPTNFEDYQKQLYVIVYTDRTVFYGRQRFSLESENVIRYDTSCLGMEDTVKISNLQYFILVQRLKFIDFLKDVEIGEVEEFALDDIDGIESLYYNEDYHLSPKQVNPRERALYWTERYIRQNLLGLDY